MLKGPMCRKILRLIRRLDKLVWAGVKMMATGMKLRLAFVWKSDYVSLRIKEMSLCSGR